MNITVIGLVLIGVFGMFYVVFTWGNNKKTVSKTVPAKVNNAAAKSNTNGNAKKPEVQRKDMFKFMEFDKITDDMILQEKESKYTMVIQCKGINYDLMSEIEQIAVEEGFITFLNTLKSPIQIYVQARAVDLKTSLDMYKSKVEDINKRYAETVDNLNKLTNDINATDKDIYNAQVQRDKFGNIAEYAQDITRYVEKLSLNKHMLQRKFYIVISYYKSEVNTTAEFSKSELHDICYRELYTRAQSIVGALQACSVSARVLTSNELAELLYISYNRDDEKIIDIKTALDSGFYRMYSTTKDIHEKKREVLQKQIDEDAMNRVEQTIKLAIANGIIKSEDEMVEEYENNVDITAVKIIDEADIKDTDKKKLQQMIVDDHNRGVEERRKQREAKEKEAEKNKQPEEQEEINNEQKEETPDENKAKKDEQNENVNKEDSSTNNSDDLIV